MAALLAAAKAAREGCVGCVEVRGAREGRSGQVCVKRGECVCVVSGLRLREGRGLLVGVASLLWYLRERTNGED